ncbi:probable TRX2-thioredoxin II [Sporisorium reilianum SRZ2]|uniref:Thioredoxin n=2 Tax=Sporisorium reilianum TaxID=72558 RepID=E7A2G5_SPORE|nr:probable TRX2-thioredoxin II [Sporisorium reilianum SRZ2]SJX63511.1 probable TRX2-thioredoxin II [Sporisorium reilianum f. sp. reilianum]
MVVKSIESYEEFQTLINGDKPIVIDFWATWCGPCRVIGPIFEKISDTPAGEKIGFFKVDVDTQEKIAQEVGIQAMPTFVFFNKGQPVKKVVGANPGALQEAISSVAGSL